jgi:hypothetical protein
LSIFAKKKPEGCAPAARALARPVVPPTTGAASPLAVIGSPACTAGAESRGMVKKAFRTFFFAQILMTLRVKPVQDRAGSPMT